LSSPDIVTDNLADPARGGKTAADLPRRADYREETIIYRSLVKEYWEMVDEINDVIDQLHAIKIGLRPKPKQRSAEDIIARDQCKREKKERREREARRIREARPMIITAPSKPVPTLAPIKLKIKTRGSKAIDNHDHKTSSFGLDWRRLQYVTPKGIG
jgi:hypothetical protein